MNSLQANPTTGEVFLRLPAPHENVIITPPRNSDAVDSLAILNDPRVYKFLTGPPFPYERHHAIEWVEQVKHRSDQILEDLREGKVVVNGCPVQHIREVQPDGTELFLGDVSVSRNRWLEIEDEDLRTRMTKENMERPVGDPGIVWTIGDYLRPSHHCKGIVSAAVGVVINQWMVPHANAHKIRALTNQDNIGSVRVFEKNGFKLVGTVKVDRVRPGRERIGGVHVLEWEQSGET